MSTINSDRELALELWNEGYRPESIVQGLSEITDDESEKLGVMYFIELWDKILTDASTEFGIDIIDLNPVSYPEVSTSDEPSIEDKFLGNVSLLLQRCVKGEVHVHKVQKNQIVIDIVSLMYPWHDVYYIPDTFLHLDRGVQTAVRYIIRRYTKYLTSSVLTPVGQNVLGEF